MERLTDRESTVDDLAANRCLATRLYNTGGGDIYSAGGGDS